MTVGRPIGVAAVLVAAASAAPAAEVWRSTFDSGADGVVNITTPDAGLLPKIGSAVSGRLTITNYDKMSGMPSNKAGRPLGATRTAANDFSALFQFRWTELWPSGLVTGYGAFDFVAFLGSANADFTKQVLGAAINHYRDTGGNYWLRLAAGVGTGGIGVSQWWFNAGSWVNLGPDLIGRDLQLAISYAGTSAGKTLGLRLYDAVGTELTRHSADLASSGLPSSTFINGLSVSHLGWTDYVGIGPIAAQNIRSAWAVDTLAFFDTANDAYNAVYHGASGGNPAWSSDRKHRLLVRVDPVSGLTRPTDELLANLPVDFTAYLGQQAPDLSTLQVVRYSPQTGQVLPFAANTFATTAGDRPFRFYDDAVPWSFPDRAGNANDTGGQATPVVYMEGGGRYFNSLGEGRSGKIAWAHTQEGSQPSYYAIYFNGLPGGTPLRQPPAGFIGDGVNRAAPMASEFAPVIHGRVDIGDLNGDGLFDLVLGNATGTVLYYPNVGRPNAPSFQYPRILMTDDGNPLDVGWSAAPKVVDWDHDGKLDLIAGAEMAGVVLYFRNVGTTGSPLFHRMGLLQAGGQTISVPASPCEEDPTNAIFTRDYYPVPEVVDWDGDGDQDLLLGGYITGRIWYYENTAGSPAAVPQLVFRGALQAVPPGGGAPRDIDVTWCAAPCAADFDGDGDLDLMSGAMQMTAGGGDLSDPEKFLWYYVNVGTRTAPQLVWRTFPKQGTFAYGILGTPRPIDFNGDGKLDLIVSTMGSLLMLPNLGTPQSPLYNASTPQTGMPWGNAPLGFSQLVDYNGDGWPDLFTGSLIQLNTGQGAPGVFGATIGLPGAEQIYHPSPRGDHWDYRAFADMGNDGLKDILVGDHQGYVWYHRDLGTAGNPQIDPSGYRLPLTTGDLLRVGTTGSGGFDELQGARTCEAPGDYNHDGWQDLVVGDTYGYIRLYIRQPGSPVVFQPPVVITNFIATRQSIQATDWNGDGWDDLLISYASATGDMIYVFLNQAQPGTAAFASPARLPLAACWGWPLVYTGDWNHDGDQDILINQYGYLRFVERSFVDHGYAATTVLGFENDGTPPPTGACCLTDGTCALTDAFSCAGKWQGAGTMCASVTCPQPGACCMADGTCTETLEELCPGVWHGPGTTCAATNCPQLGACCLPDGTCGETLEVDCTGHWAGPDTTCAQTNCVVATGEAWWETFNDGTADGVVQFMNGNTSPPHNQIGPVTSGRLQITTWDYNPSDANIWQPAKSGRPLGVAKTSSDSFSGLYVFRWSSLQASSTQAHEFAGFMGDTQPWQTRPVCGALLRHWKSGANYYVQLGVGFGSIGYTNFGELWGQTLSLGTTPGVNTCRLAVGYNGTTHVLSVGLYDVNGNQLGRMNPDLDTDVPSLQGPGSTSQEIASLAVNYLGWMDYRASGGNLATVWQTDDLVYFETAQGAFHEAQHPARIRADLDFDGDVDLTDLSTFQRCYNGPNRVPADSDCHGADLDHDSDVDLSDFGLFQACFNGPNRPPACAP